VSFRASAASRREPAVRSRAHKALEAILHARSADAWTASPAKRGRLDGKSREARTSGRQVPQMPGAPSFRDFAKVWIPLPNPASTWLTECSLQKHEGERVKRSPLVLPFYCLLTSSSLPSLLPSLPVSWLPFSLPWLSILPFRCDIESAALLLQLTNV